MEINISFSKEEIEEILKYKLWQKIKYKLYLGLEELKQEDAEDENKKLMEVR